MFTLKLEWPPHCRSLTFGSQSPKLHKDSQGLCLAALLMPILCAVFFSGGGLLPFLIILVLFFKSVEECAQATQAVAAQGTLEDRIAEQGSSAAAAGEAAALDLEEAVPLLSTWMHMVAYERTSARGHISSTVFTYMSILIHLQQILLHLCYKMTITV